jgi:uridine nucleosidase
MPRRILIDTDPGVDDAMAILFALRSSELELVGVTTVFGNAIVEQTTRNALRILEVAGRSDVPVAAGAARPLVRLPRRLNSPVHGNDGLGNAFLDAPPPAGRPLEISAAEQIVRTVMDRPGELTLIAIGPLTNLAVALRLEPRLATSVAEVIIMGGAAFRRGNASPVAESNIHDDPEAAAVVFGAAWPLTMVGLDVTMQTIQSDAQLAAIWSAGTPQTDFLARIVPAYRGFYRERYAAERDIPPYRPDGLPTHDPSAIAYAIQPGLFRTVRLPVWVETEGRGAGQTIPDHRHWWGDAPEVDVCVEVQADRLLDLLHQRLTGRPS